jgi:hypothetical protein
VEPQLVTLADLTKSSHIVRTFWAQHSINEERETSFGSILLDELFKFGGESYHAKSRLSDEKRDSKSEGSCSPCRMLFDPSPSFARTCSSKRGGRDV